jgi:hypothetical protein
VVPEPGASDSPRTLTAAARSAGAEPPAT